MRDIGSDVEQRSHDSDHVVTVQRRLIGHRGMVASSPLYRKTLRGTGQKRLCACFPFGAPRWARPRSVMILPRGVRWR